jgi:hypothetical protein
MKFKAEYTFREEDEKELIKKLIETFHLSHYLLPFYSIYFYLSHQIVIYCLESFFDQ